MRKFHLRCAVLAIAGGAMVLAAGAQARPIFIKFDGVDGEAQAGSDHKDWIELAFVSVAPAERNRVRVAAGDLNSARAAGSTPAAPRAVTARSPNPVPVGLLLPAVQKVREAAAARPAGAACRIGEVRGPVAVMESESGATGRILDVTVTGCSGEEISFNFTKIEWD